VTLTLRQRLQRAARSIRRTVAGWFSALAIRINGHEDEWHPKPRAWPEYGPDSCMTEGALALLILEGVVVPLAPAKRLDGSFTGPTICVLCNDLFWWGTADAEELPPLGFGEEDEAPFWDLYARVRRDGHHGAEVWCCIHRGMRPQTPIEKDWRTSGRWTPELEALPPRNPKECG
jgi:hypothetical protein